LKKAATCPRRLTEEGRPGFAQAREKVLFLSDIFPTGFMAAE
jgi:hypothetical protein